MTERNVKRDEALQASRRFPRLNKQQDLELRALMVSSLEEAGGVLVCENMDALCSQLSEKFSSTLKLTPNIVDRRFRFMQSAGGVTFDRSSTSGLAYITAVRMLDRNKCLQQTARRKSQKVNYPPDARKRRIDAILALLRGQPSVVNIGRIIAELREQHPGIGTQWSWYDTVYGLERIGRVRITPIKRGQRKLELVKGAAKRSDSNARPSPSEKRTGRSTPTRDRMPTREELIACRADLEQTQMETAAEIARIDKILKRMDDLAAYTRQELGD